MRPGLILPLEILIQHPRVQAIDAAVEYVRVFLDLVAASGLEVVDWTFDPASPRPTRHQNGILDARVKLLLPGEAHDFGAILVRLFLVVGELSGHIGVVAEHVPTPYAIEPSYIHGQAFPPSFA